MNLWHPALSFDFFFHPNVIYFNIRDGQPLDLSGSPDFFFAFVGEKNTWAGQVDYFYRRKNGGMVRHYCRPATHPDLILISRFFSTNLDLEVSWFHMWKSQFFCFVSKCFEIRKTKRRLALSHVPCLQKAHKVWAKNKFYDRLNWRPWLNPLHTATQRVK